MGMGMGMWFDGNKVVWITSTSSSAKVTGTIKASEWDRDRSATQNLAQTRKGKKTAGKDFNFFRESA